MKPRLSYPPPNNLLALMGRERMVMTIKDIQEAIEKIEAVKNDDEAAHTYEDDLHKDVLHAIADGTAEDPRAMAELTLTTVDIKFARWCA